ncbi:hypothetical protein CPC08DRAFT_76266 [Agrocybe pediades]|nr:hypothetical protein CPC08DRAFT_76266 [Agrocybe pediades]
MTKKSVAFSELPLDVVFEILGFLPVEDIIRIRYVCRSLRSASYQRTIWATAYKRSELLLPEGPSCDQDASQLEELLVRASRIRRNWTSSCPMTFSKRQFPHRLPAHSFDANVISGRFLQLAQKDGLAWYDLDANLSSLPIMAYPCRNVNTAVGFLNHQVNADGQGPGVAWVAFVCDQPPSTIVILKVDFSRLEVALHSRVPANNLIAMTLSHDWLLPVREFRSADDPMDLYHIPTKSLISFPMHERVRHLSDLTRMNFIITSQFLFLLLSVHSETLVDVYPLPQNESADEMPSNLVRSHTGSYPHPISKLQLFDPSIVNTSIHPIEQDIQLSFLGLIFVNRGPTGWTSKIGLHLFDMILHPDGNLTFTTQSERILNVGMSSTELYHCSRSGQCLAVTHSTPGPVIFAHHIQRKDSGCVMNVKSIKVPELAQIRDMLGFDGFTGRICLVNGFSNIEILDCA